MRFQINDYICIVVVDYSTKCLFRLKARLLLPKSGLFLALN